MIIHGLWFYDELRDFIGNPDIRKRKFATPNYGELEVYVNSNRLQLLRQSPMCVSCYRIGRIWSLERPSYRKHSHHPYQVPHFNLYAVENGSWVLMTADHIIPKSRGGKNDLSNLQVMCENCNAKKGNNLDVQTLLFAKLRYEREMHP